MSRVLVFLLWLAGASGVSDRDLAAHRTEVETWRMKRLASLQRSDGWLTLVGLFWLEPGDNRVGSDPDAAVRLPAGKAPARLGAITLDASTIRFQAAPHVAVTCDGKPAAACVLKSDAENEPTLLQHGSLSFYVIKRGERFGVRVKDSDATARSRFHGLENFPIVERFRFVARFEKYEPPKRISVPNILGKETLETSPGALVFEHEGRTYRLDPMLESGATDLFVVFGDATNGRETYGGGRFLYVSPPVDGRTVLDFNKAYNPPCVFSPYATCPLPPAQNRLPISIEAGEKTYKHQ